MVAGLIAHLPDVDLQSGDGIAQQWADPVRKQSLIEVVGHACLPNGSDSIRLDNRTRTLISPGIALVPSRLERTDLGVIGVVAVPVCIFAKPPVAGEVKTRLIPVLGADDAAELAKAMLTDVWRTVELCVGVCPILATTRPGEFPVSVAHEDMWLQGEGDLGQRIERILTRALEHAPAAMAIGADCPGLTQKHLRAALDGLQRNDAVLGPSLDGGFYLLALPKCPPGLFSSLPWSTSETRLRLKTRLEEHGLSVAELEPLFDVDSPGDLVCLERHLASNSSLAPATRDWYVRNRKKLAP
jgi:uncharacterized protein